MGKAKKSKNAKKARAGQIRQEEQQNKAPHSFVFNRGAVGKNIKELINDMRRVMSPYTASQLKVRKKNVLKDFVSVAGPLNVSHFLLFTKTETTNNLRIMRLPRGPTLTFQIKSYCLSRDVIASLKRHNMEPKQFLHHPLLVMNNFSGEGMQLKLMATMFQNMFPSINVNRVNLGAIRRCVLLQYNSEDKTIQFRHYNIRIVPVGMSRGVKKIVKSKVPNLARFGDISEFLTRGGDLSESEAELDGPENEVILPQDLNTRGNIKAQKSAIRLTEIGPRMTLQLVKIEEGLSQGPVLFHEFISKTPEELQTMEESKAKKKKEKEDRRRRQEENVQRKKEEKESQKAKSLAGMKKNDTEKNEDMSDDGSYKSASEEEDDDVEYYRQEVGEDPDPDLQLRSSKKSVIHRGTKRKSPSKSNSPVAGKKPRLEKKFRQKITQDVAGKRKGKFSKKQEEQKGNQKKQFKEKAQKRGKFEKHGQTREHKKFDNKKGLNKRKQSKKKGMKMGRRR